MLKNLAQPIMLSTSENRVNSRQATNGSLDQAKQGVL